MQVHIFEVILMVLIGIIGFFLVRLISSLDELNKSHGEFKSGFTTEMALVKRDIEQNEEHNTMVKDLVSKMNLIQREIESISNMGKELMNIKEETVIMKRDQNSMWKRIDEIKESGSRIDKEILLLRSRTHWIINKLTIIKAKAEKEGWEFKTDWEFSDK